MSQGKEEETMTKRVRGNGNRKHGAKWADLICPVGRTCVRPDLRDMMPRGPDKFMRELAREFGGIFRADLMDAGLPVARGFDGHGIPHDLIAVELLDGADIEADLIDAGDGFIPLEQIGQEHVLGCNSDDSFDNCCGVIAAQLIQNPKTLRFHGIHVTPQTRIPDLMRLPAFLDLVSQMMDTSEIELLLAPA